MKQLIFKQHYYLFIFLFILSPMLGQNKIQQRDISYWLRTAHKKIKLNYPTHPVLSNSFYYEKEETSSGNYSSFHESILHIYRTDYQHKKRQEQITRTQILQQKRTDSLNGKAIYIEKVYTPTISLLQTDFVFHKSPFICPSHFDQFKYRLDSFCHFQQKLCIAISFASKKENNQYISGTLYIDTISKAYVGALLWLPRPNSIYIGRGTYTSNNYYGGTNIKITYYPFFNKKWHLQKITYNTDKDRLAQNKEKIKKQMVLKTLFADTSNISPIDYTTRLLPSQIERTSLKRKNKLKKQKVYNAFFIGTKAIKITNSNQFKYTNSQQQSCLISPQNRQQQVLYLGNELAIPLTKRWRLTGRTSMSLNLNNFGLESDLLLTYRKPLSSTANWFIELSLGYSLQTSYFFLEKIKNPDKTTFTIEQKRFDSNNLLINAKQKQHGFLPTITLAYAPFSSRYEYYSSISYLLPLQENSTIRFKESSGNIFTRKSKDLKLNNQSFDSFGKNIPHINQNRLYLILGIRYKLHYYK